MKYSMVSLQIISVPALAIVISLLFLLFFKMVSIVRETPVDVNVKNRDYVPPGEIKTVDYEGIPYSTFAFFISDTLPTFGRWATSFGLFGILHFVISTYLLVIIIILLYIVMKGTPAAMVGVAATLVIWLILPFFEVKEYSVLTKSGFRPKSIDFHFFGLFIELLLIYFVFWSVFSIDNNILSAISIYALLHYHDLIFIPIFTTMLIEECEASRDIG